MNSPLSWLALASCLILSSCCHSAPPAGCAPVRKVTVVGNAIIRVAPDQMLWNVQISVNDATLAAAKYTHDASMTATLNYLKSLGDAVKDTQTSGIRFDKQNYFPPDADKSKPFSCSTQVTFILTDFDKYGPICDELAKIEGLQVQGVDYAYSKHDEVSRDALKLALTNAHDKANDLAGTASCNLGAPLEIIEGNDNNPGPRPVFRMMAAAPAGGTPAPVAGRIEINGTVTTTYELDPK